MRKRKDCNGRDSRGNHGQRKEVRKFDIWKRREVTEKKSSTRFESVSGRET